MTAYPEMDDNGAYHFGSLRAKGFDHLVKLYQDGRVMTSDGKIHDCKVKAAVWLHSTDGPAELVGARA